MLIIITISIVCRVVKERLDLRPKKGARLQMFLLIQIKVADWRIHSRWPVRRILRSDPLVDAALLHTSRHIG